MVNYINLYYMYIRYIYVHNIFKYIFLGMKPQLNIIELLGMVRTYALDLEDSRIFQNFYITLPVNLSLVEKVVWLISQLSMFKLRGK